MLPGAGAWVAGPDRPHHADLAEAAFVGLPATLRGLLDGERGAFRRGALDPDGITDREKGVHTFYHTYEPATGSGGGVYRVELSLHEASMTLREGKPAAEAAYQLGFLSHFVADLAVPFHTANGLYELERHEGYERLAYDRRDTYSVAPTRAPREVHDPAAYAKALATQSEALARDLLDALDASSDAWSPEVQRIAERTAALAVDAMADMLYTAYVRADPSRPEPAFDAQLPVPGDLDDLGVSVRLLRETHPFLVVATFFSVAALALGVILIAKRRRPSG